MQPWLIAVIVIVVILVALLGFAIVSYQMIFGRRYDKNPLLKYFTETDFSLAAEGVRLGKLCGKVYTDAAVTKNGGVIIFAHGMGPGHCAYMTEIAYFCRRGYTVVAVDSLGCGMSSGKSMRGMYEGVKTVVAAFDYVKARFPDKEIYLVGHSWGAYSVMCASKLRKAEKVVAISAPDSPVKAAYDGASNVMSKLFALILCPFWYAAGFLKFGVRGNERASVCVKKSGAPTLIIHGDKDTVVALNGSAYVKSNGVNVEKYLSEGKAHNPYNTIAAQKLLSELSANLSDYKKTGRAYFDNFDFTAATEEDGEVMLKIIGFLE